MTDTEEKRSSATQVKISNLDSTFFLTENERSRHFYKLLTQIVGVTLFCQVEKRDILTGPMHGIANRTIL